MHDFFRTLAPERFNATVTIHADGSYSYSYDGVLIFVPALVQSNRAGLDARAEAQLGKAAEQLLREGFRKANYLGRGRYAVVLERTVGKGESSFFPSKEMKLFSIRPQHDGSIVVGAFRPDSTSPCQLAGSDAEIDGRLNVTVDRGVKVLQHNALANQSTHEPVFRWCIKSPDADPRIVLQPHV